MAAIPVSPVLLSQESRVAVVSRCTIRKFPDICIATCLISPFTDITPPIYHSRNTSIGPSHNNFILSMPPLFIGNSRHCIYFLSNPLLRPRSFLPVRQTKRPMPPILSELLSFSYLSYVQRFISNPVQATSTPRTTPLLQPPSQPDFTQKPPHRTFCLNQSHSHKSLLFNTLPRAARFRQLPLPTSHPCHSPL